MNKNCSLNFHVRLNVETIDSKYFLNDEISFE